MKPIKHKQFVTNILVATLALTCATGLQAASSKKNPTSKLYVSEVKGQCEINNGEVVQDLAEKSVHNAEGVVIETKDDSTQAMVLSNGTGVYFEPDTRLDIQRFQQEPFRPNRQDLETEPSVSQTRGFVPRGAIGMCNSRLVAGSSMVYKTPDASVNIRAQQLSIECKDGETKISIVRGDATVQTDELGGGEVLKAGQQAIIRRTTPNAPPVITIQPIPDSEKGVIDDRVAIACMSRRQVYFDVANQESAFVNEANAPEAAPELVAVEVTPTNPNEIGPIVSNTQIRGNNGFGNGDQTAPGNSGSNNNAENAGAISP